MNRIVTIKSILRPKFLLLALLLTGLVFSGCASGTVPRGWSGVAVADGTLFLGSMDGRVVAVNTANGSLAWAVPLQNPASRGGGFGCAPTATNAIIYGTPAVDGDIVYVSSFNAKLYAISSANRLSKETYLRRDDKSLPENLIGGPTVAEERVYAGSSDGLIYALDTVSLEKRWQFDTTGKIWSTPFIEGDTLYVTSFAKKIYALNANDGGKKWEFKTEGAIVSSPVVDGGVVYFGSLDRYFYALNAADGSLKWKARAGNWFWSKPLVRSGVVYAANLDGKVYAFDAGSGQQTVEFSLGSPASAAPVLVDNQLIVVTESGVVFSLDTSSRQQKRLVELGEKVYASPAATAGKVFIHTNLDKLYEVDAQTGAKRELNIK